MRFPSQRDRLQRVVSDKLDTLKLSDTITHVDVNGPGLVIAGGPPPVPTTGWTVGVSLKHNVLLGQPDIVITIPVAGVLPPDEIFEKVGEFLLEKARQERDKANYVDPESNPDSESLPAGLRGKTIEL